MSLFAKGKIRNKKKYNFEIKGKKAVAFALVVDNEAFETPVRIKCQKDMFNSVDEGDEVEIPVVASFSQYGDAPAKLQIRVEEDIYLKLNGEEEEE